MPNGHVTCIPLVYVFRYISLELKAYEPKGLEAHEAEDMRSEGVESI